MQALALFSIVRRSMHLSVTRTWGNRTLPLKSTAWRKLRAEIIQRDDRTCESCAYKSPHPIGRGLVVDHRDGDASNNDPTNLRVHCPPCDAIRHCGLSGLNGWIELAKSDMEQVEIVRKTREIVEQTGDVPPVRDVDPFATPAQMSTVDLANRLLKVDWEDLTEEEKALRGFFTERTGRMFAITRN
jgi:HNH endonuclease